MASLTAEIAQRKAALREVAKAVKTVVTSINKVSRLIQQLLNRKQALPDEKDLARLLSLLGNAVKIISTLSSIPAKLQDVWRI